MKNCSNFDLNKVRKVKLDILIFRVKKEKRKNSFLKIP